MTRIGVWFVVCLFATTTGASASQIGSAAATGVVRDQAGATIPGVTLKFIDSTRNVRRTAVSSSAGVYTVTGLTPGVYRVEIQFAGFRPLVREAVTLETGETLRLDFELEVGGVQESVTVTGDTPLIRTATATLGEVVSHENIVNLPLNGRSFVTLASLTPGVALPQGSVLPRINGGRPRTNEYVFDGISVLQPEPGQVAFFPVLDAIQEFKIETNSPPAEFGRFNGGVINLTTRAGSNAFHGTTFDFVRHEALNARNAFASITPVKPRFRRQQFGGVLGGPVRRDRMFFFLDYQGQRQTIGRTVLSTVPTVLQRQGIFTEPVAGRVPTIYNPGTTAPNGSGGFTRLPFAGNLIPSDQLDPVALVLLSRYPLPTSPGTANNYRRTDNELDDQDQLDLRIDQRAASGQLFGRLSYFEGRFTPVTPLPDGSGVTSGTLGPQTTRAWAFASNVQHVFSDRWLNELRAGDTRRAVSRSAVSIDGSGIEPIRIPGIPATIQFPNTLPTFQVGGYQQLGSPPNTASEFSTGVTQLADSLTWLKARHTVKFGFDWRWERLNVIQPPSPTGLFQFTSLFTDLPGVVNTGAPLASFLLGQVQDFSIDLQQRQIRHRARFQEFFVQDDWKISDRITIAPGLRYTLNFPSTEEHDQAAVFNLQTQQLDFLGREGHPRSARELQKLNFGPRLGIVARLNDETAISSGYALVWIEQAGITTPFTVPVFPFLQTVSQRTLDSVTPAFVLAQGPNVAPIPLTPAAGLGQGVFAMDRDLGSGYVQQWNLSLQRQVKTNIVVEVAYVGSKITRVGIPDTNLNQLSVDQLALGTALLQRVPNPFVDTISSSSSLGDPTISVAQLLKPYPQYTTVSLYRNNVGTSFYQGVTAKIEQRLSRGLSYLVSYTRSHLEDDASSVFDASILTGPVVNYPVADSFNRVLERDVSTGDIPHAFVSSLVWELPAGAGRALTPHGLLGALVTDWMLAAIVTLQSGTPVPVIQATNFNAFAGFGTQRPTLVGDPVLPPEERTVDRWFNTSAFATTPQFAIGTASRNPIRGPGYRGVDVALARRVRLGSSVSLEVRGELFNLLNTPPLGNPNTVLGASNFGTITSAGDPRVAQLAMKLLF